MLATASLSVLLRVLASRLLPAPCGLCCHSRPYSPVNYSIPLPAFQSARRISEPWRPLRCSLSRFCNCFSAATPTKRLCDRLRSGLFLVFGHFYAAKRISGLRRGFRCQAAAGYNHSRHYRIHPSNGGWYVDTLEHEVTELVGIFPALTSRP